MFFFLSGLPRTGSTLLSSILSQNPDIHAEGNSAVCQLMWDMQQSCEISAAQQLQANNRFTDQDAFVSSIPNIYYRNVKKKYIVDKCRSWTLSPNMEIIRRYITNNPKIIVLTRPVEEIVKSFIRLRKKNGWTGDLESDLWVPGSEPIMRSLDGVKHAQKTNKGEFLFVSYEDLINDTKLVIEKIYTFFELELFEHDFNNITNLFPENDLIYGLIGMHDIRPSIEKITIK